MGNAHHRLVKLFGSTDALCRDAHHTLGAAAAVMT